MPIYLKDVDVVPEVAKFKSALIVLCRFCPAASLAMRKDKPYIEFFRRFLKTESYEQLINNMQSRLDKEGLKTDVFKGSLLPMPLNFIICFWNSGQREKLLKHARQYEAIVVMGCEAAYQSVCKILKSTDCQIKFSNQPIVKYSLAWNLKVFLRLYRNSVYPSIYHSNYPM